MMPICTTSAGDSAAGHAALQSTVNTLMVCEAHLRYKQLNHPVPTHLDIDMLPMKNNQGSAKGQQLFLNNYTDPSTVFTKVPRIYSDLMAATKETLVKKIKAKFKCEDADTIVQVRACTGRRVAVSASVPCPCCTQMDLETQLPN